MKKSCITTSKAGIFIETDINFHGFNTLNGSFFKSLASCLNRVRVLIFKSHFLLHSPDAAIYGVLVKFLYIYLKRHLYFFFEEFHVMHHLRRRLDANSGNYTQLYLSDNIRSFRLHFYPSPLVLSSATMIRLVI